MVLTYQTGLDESEKEEIVCDVRLELIVLRIRGVVLWDCQDADGSHEQCSPEPAGNPRIHRHTDRQA